MSFKKFIQELNRRHVIKAGLAYLIVAWLITQVLSIIIPAYELTPSLLKSAITVLSIGFPIWIAFSWFYDVTPEGIKKAIDVEFNASEVKKKNVNLNRFIIGALSVAVILLAYNQIKMKDAISKEIVSVQIKDDRNSIAVLPFSNLSPNEENGFFADGMHEDVLNKLAHLKELRVMSRTTVLRYRDFEGDLKEIGDQLKVQYVVEGTVSRWENSVKVTAKLVDANTNETRWSDNYTGELINVFELQSSIAQAIVEALKTEITQEELSDLNKPLTDNIEAYDQYLKARDILNSSYYNFEELKAAIMLLDKAVSLDDNFVASWSLLAISQSELYWRLNQAKDETEINDAKEEAEKALIKLNELQPEGAHFFKANGYFQNVVMKDRIAALESFNKALEVFPNDAETLVYLPRIYFELGQLDNAVDVLEKAFRLDKSNGNVNYGLTFAYELKHRYADAVPVLENLLKLEPEKTHYNVQAKYFQFLSDGQLSSFNAYEDAVNTVEKTEKYDSRSVLNNQMVVAMFNDDYESYAESWQGKYDQHHKNHGEWACPMIINDEANQARLMFENGKPELAEEIILKAQENITRPYIKGAFCIFNKGAYNPKLDYMSGNINAAKVQFEAIVPEIMNNAEYPRGPVERAVLLETADMVASDRVYSIYKQITSKPLSFVSMETVCANPWTYPNLVKNANFIKEVQDDGRFVEFLQHYGLLSNEKI